MKVWILVRDGDGLKMERMYERVTKVTISPLLLATIQMEDKDSATYCLSAGCEMKMEETKHEDTNT